MVNHSRLIIPLNLINSITLKKPKKFIYLALFALAFLAQAPSNLLHAQTGNGGAETDPDALAAAVDEANAAGASPTRGLAVAGSHLANPGAPAVDTSAVMKRLPMHGMGPIGRRRASSKPPGLPADPCRDVVTVTILEQLSYSGHRFNPLNARCFRASTDLEAKKNTYGVRYINPANPEYIGAEAGGVVDLNPKGYYIAIDKSSNPTKSEMCTDPNVGNVLSDVPNAANLIKNTLSPVFREYTRTDGTQDGECYCRQNRTLANPNGELLPCSGTAFSDALQAAVDTVSLATRPTQVDPPVVVNTNTGGRANLAAGPSPAPAVVQQQSQSRVTACINAAVANANSCRTLANTAKTDCDRAKEENGTNNMLGGVVGAGAQMNTMMRTGTGAQGNCMRGSMIAMATTVMLQKMGETCEPKVNTCKSSCKPDSYDKFLDECLAANGTSANALTDSTNTTPEADLFRRSNEQIMSGFDRADRICNRELAGLMSDTEKLMNGLGNSMQSSLQCACQTSNAAGANCEAVPNINNCNTNPSLQGCEMYSTLGACVPGAVGYDAKTCNCLENPAATGCGTAGSTTPATLFGGGLRGGPAAGSAFATGGATGAGGSGRASNLDLGGASEAVQSNLTAASGTGVTTSGGSSYGGTTSGGGGNGSASPEEVAAGAPTETGLSGLFNQAKNAVMGALGRGGSNRSRAAGKGAAAEVNMKKFKPLRGLANTDGMGTRNMDIWKMVNMCANGETCASNRNNYMMAP